MTEQENLRKQAGHTLKSLAEATGLSERTVWRWEQGESVSASTRKRLEAELQFSTPPTLLAEKQAALGKAVRAAREQAGLSTYQLGDKTGLMAKTIQDFETGKRRPNGITLAAIEKGLGFKTGVLEQILDPEWPGTIDDIRVAGLFGLSDSAPSTDADLVAEIGRRLQEKDHRIKFLEDQLAALQEAIRGVVPQDVFDLAADDPGTPSAGQRMADEDDTRGEEPQA